jgi:para-aminobenzoate synthetase component I
LVNASPNPFSAYYKKENAYLCCASPERFLQKKGDTLFSQPIKGTAPRDLNNATQDQALQKALGESAKEKRENVMVVDLVRNDMSRVCQPGSVEVSELFGLYRFPQVHQMISTIQGKVLAGVLPSQIFGACFPMGSMTGAPKAKVLDLIATYENAPRGLYSGAVGYFTPMGDFDFNVVIRSLLYNAETQTLRYGVGSGVTAASSAPSEYEECLLKAAAIRALWAH